MQCNAMQHITAQYSAAHAQCSANIILNKKKLFQISLQLLSRLSLKELVSTYILLMVFAMRGKDRKSDTLSLLFKFLTSCENNWM